MAAEAHRVDQRSSGGQVSGEQEKIKDGDLSSSNIHEGVEDASERVSGFWKRIGNIFSGKPGFKEEGLAHRARCPKESRRMRPEKCLLDLKTMKFYMTFPRAVSMN